MFENPSRGRQARNFTTNVPKIVDLKSGRCVDDVAFAELRDVFCFAVVFFDPLADEF